MLVRDWQFPCDETPYGAEGGRRVLTQALEVRSDWVGFHCRLSLQRLLRHIVTKKNELELPPPPLN